jgi:Zn-dependent protease
VEDSFRLGRIAGISVGVNWSLLVVFWLITWALAGARFPDQYPDEATAAYWVAAAATALLFYASLLAHEMAHALVARAKGVHVEGITLWLFGGVAKLDRDATTPEDELRITGVGPLVSLGAAAVFFAVSLALDAVGVPDLAVGAFRWLALINVILAVFNLIPAAPLDGGRILRALLWRRWDDRVRAAVVSSRAGRVFGYVLIGLGLLEFAAGAGLGGLWFVFLGWFLLNAARAEEQHVLLRGALDGVKVRDVMTPHPHVAPDWMPVDEFLEEHLWRHRFSAFPVRDLDGKLTGLVTLARLKTVRSDRRSEVTVREIACPLGEVASAAPDEPLLDLLPRLSECTDGRALVFSDGELVGIVSPTDVNRALTFASLRSSPERAV